MNKTCIPAFALIATLLTTAATAQAPKTLTMNGQVASTRVRLINGEAFVPVADVAKALGQSVAVTPGGYTIRVAGGANEITGNLQGKVGDVLFDGRWRFQVVNVTRMDSYTEQHAPDPEAVTPKSDGDTLLVVNCEVKNGLKKPQPLGFFPIYAHTALADDQGASYSPIDADIRSAPHLRGLVTDPLLPGAKTDFALVFSVPKSANINALVFTLTNDVGKPTSDARVTLDKANG